MPNIKKLTIKEYAELRGITQPSVSQAIKNGMPIGVVKIDLPTGYVLHVDTDKIKELTKNSKK